MIQLTNTGLQIDDLNTIFDNLATEYKKIYGGEDITIDGDTSDGQVISIYSKLNADIQANLLQLYNSFDPDNALGVALNKIIKLSGLTRTPATKSTVSVDITATSNVDLDSEYKVVDELGQVWQIITAQTLLAGTTSVDFAAVEWGSIATNPNTITAQGTILTQITTVNNPLAASVGVDEETDEALRIRRNKSLEKPAYSTVGGLLAELLSVANVLDVKIYENKTDTYDATLDLNAHSIWCIVDGGLDTDIFETIAKEKTSGCDLKGSITGTYVENFLRADGTTLVYNHEVNYDVPNEVEIYIKLDVTPKIFGDVIDTQLIKDSLITKLFNISEDLTITELYSFVYSGGTNFIATSLQASLDDINYVSDELLAGSADKFLITDAKITITEI